MSTKTQTRRGAGNATQNVSTLDQAAMYGLLDSYTLYGVGTPLYRVLSTKGTLRPVNSLDDAFESFDKTKAALAELQCGFTYSNKYESYSMGIKVKGGIMYASIQHDKDGRPLELSNYKLCEVEVTRDFVLPGETEPILREGDKFLKVLDPEYKGA